MKPIGPMLHNLITGELAILSALEDRRWKTSHEVGEITGLASFQVRSMLNGLRRQRLTVAGSNFETVGLWTITDAGAQELAARRQLTIVTGGA